MGNFATEPKYLFKYELKNCHPKHNSFYVSSFGSSPNEYFWGAVQEMISFGKIKFF